MFDVDKRIYLKFEKHQGAYVSSQLTVVLGNQLHLLRSCLGIDTDARDKDTRNKKQRKIEQREKSPG